MTVVHIATLAGARDAIDAGADGLAHIFNDVAPDPEFGRFVAAHHAFVVPTLSVNESAAGVPSGASLTTDARLQPYLSASEMENLKGSFPARPGAPHNIDNASAAVRQLKAAGVPILAGTDAPNPGTAHGASIHRELELLVKAGLTPVEALTAATSTPARMFHLDRSRPHRRPDFAPTSCSSTAIRRPTSSPRATSPPSGRAAFRSTREPETKESAAGSRDSAGRTNSRQA